MESLAQHFDNSRHGGAGKRRSFFRFRSGKNKKNNNNNQNSKKKEGGRSFFTQGDVPLLGHSRKFVKSKSSDNYAPSPDVFKMMSETERQEIFQHSLRFLGKKLVHEEEQEAIARVYSTPNFPAPSSTTPDTSLDPSDSYRSKESASPVDDHHRHHHEHDDDDYGDNHRAVMAAARRQQQEQESTIESQSILSGVEHEYYEDDEEESDSVYTTRFWVKALSSCTAPQLECGPAARSRLSNMGIATGNNSILKMDKVICVAADAEPYNVGTTTTATTTNHHHHPRSSSRGRDNQYSGTLEQYYSKPPLHPRHEERYQQRQQQRQRSSCSSDPDRCETPVPSEIHSSPRLSMPDKNFFEFKVRDDDSTISTRLSVYMHD